jgi:membrane-bound ClpP family serine protease
MYRIKYSLVMCLSQIWEPTRVSGEVFQQGWGGCIKFLGVLWRACSTGGQIHIAPDNVVSVVARRGNTLLVISLADNPLKQLRTC